MIEIDGAQGEGGGQILRSALSLSMITGQPFRLINIRAGRAKPGLLRQHLVAVQAAAAICGARMTPVALGASSLEFVPGTLRGGDYRFAIGSAGSCTLVLQTLLPALLHADAPSTVRISGGTHNPMAPPVHFLQRAYGRAMAQMGADIDIALGRYGFYPAGGGEVIATVQPCARLKPIALLQRGERQAGFAESVVAGVHVNVAQRELERVASGMGWSGKQLRIVGLPAEQGPGNVLLLTLEHEHVTEVFASFGEKSLLAESVAKRLLNEVRAYCKSDAAVGEHLADQLLLPMALAGGGTFSCSKVSQHALTNAEVIARFLPVRITFEQQERASICTVAAA
ncbi:RNA 3'-terminal phosphate cyclase [Janthinobacterium sp. 1_2014MBL_MicDiv]|uniref:RNA 3'-terminal phosphate cyclase n=1 Tax=Janthinobacterium sp. 1_2014MBL_MicDiv TaxID=1644131 RepID=UPI0008F5331A|nr:RNA 3'-terminal phosphate cyclase [Janthinobacterium sp. 1_2014MBL_MicDiv]APA70060.1 RNA 3'-terminal-phosphate cyclase [Janthinobacterium sp. 1_2014MBL_MicDiv]